MRRSLLWLATFLQFTAPAFGQTAPDTVFQKVTATVTSNAPIYVVPQPGPTLGPIRTAAVGTVLVVINEKDDWLQVEFNDPQYGRRVGWVQKKLVRVDDPALRPIDLSVPARPPGAPPSAATVPSSPGGVQAADSTDPAARQGFTMLLNLGIGIQKDEALEDAAVGLGGLNVGLGGFINRDLALMFRFSGTNVTQEVGLLSSFSQVSGVGAASVQYWVSDRVNIEGGVGFGFWTTEFESDQGLGLVLGVGAVVFKKGKHALQVGFEYAPAFTQPGTVHNVGITFGYQFHR